ncbi:MAG: restriction endonuclease subunit S [Treponema sp.]|nr:restriction endonuclease subunit S [Treponema sp.]
MSEREVPRGYKETEIGIIPIEWELDSAEKLMTIETGSRNTENKTYNGRYPFFVRSQQIERIDSYSYDCEAVLTAGDGVGTGKVYHYFIGKFDAHQRVYIMTHFCGINGIFFFYFFKQNFLDEVIKYTAKSSVDSIRRNMIAKMQIPLPSLPEQQAIAEALSDVDSLIENLEMLIKKKKAIKQGAMQELLTGKQRLPGFEEEWVEKKLGELLFYEQPQKYIVRNTEYVESGIPVLTAGKSLVLGYTHETDNLYTNLPVIIFDDFTTESKYINFLFKIKSSAMKMLTSSGLCNLHFIFERMQMIDFILKDHQRYWISEYSKIKVKIPLSHEEQTAIADILSDMDNEIELLTAKLNKTKQIKQGMMQELLTGRKRIWKPEEKIIMFPVYKTGHTPQFDDAVMIAGIVNVFYSEKYPLGRKKVQKLLYLLHRHQDKSTTAFKKKAAGPYADEVRYKGGEPIARNSQYITTNTVKGKGTTFAKGANIEKALEYINTWGKQNDIQWLIENFRFKTVDELELLATVDMIISDLNKEGTPVSIDSIKYLIATNNEWKAKLQKTIFGDIMIAKSIKDLEKLF